MRKKRTGYSIPVGRMDFSTRRDVIASKAITVAPDRIAYCTPCSFYNCFDDSSLIFLVSEREGEIQRQAKERSTLILLIELNSRARNF